MMREGGEERKKYGQAERQEGGREGREQNQVSRCVLQHRSTPVLFLRLLERKSLIKQHTIIVPGSHGCIEAVFFLLFFILFLFFLLSLSLSLSYTRKQTRKTKERNRKQTTTHKNDGRKRKRMKERKG